MLRRQEALRANKGAYYEGGIRVPLIIKWPGVSRAGRVIHEPVISNDLYPTCLSAGGLALRPNQHSDGVNLIAGEFRSCFRFHRSQATTDTRAPVSSDHTGDFWFVLGYRNGGNRFPSVKRDSKWTTSLVDFVCTSLDEAFV